jgi:hypothetical protein
MHKYGHNIRKSPAGFIWVKVKVKVKGHDLKVLKTQQVWYSERGNFVQLPCIYLRPCGLHIWHDLRATSGKMRTVVETRIRLPVPKI